MKKFSFFMVMLVALFQANGQQKVEDIKNILTFLEEKAKIEDDYYDTAYSVIQAQIKATKKDVPNNAIWHSFMAEFLSNYFDNNQYMINERTPVEGEEQADFKTWSRVQFEKQIHLHFQKSIENKTVLQTIPIKKYALLLDNTSSFPYRPTLYDFLAHRALDFYEKDYNENFREFLTFDSTFLADNLLFITLSFEPPQKIGYQYQALKIFQELTRLHLNTSSTLPLIDITLQRLDYCRSHSTLKNEGELYVNALLNFYDRYQYSEGKEDILYAFGEFYYDRGRDYNRTKDTLYRLDYKKAYHYYNQVIKVAAAGSRVANNAKERIFNITKPSVEFNMDRNIAPQQPTLFTVKYANCDTLFFRIIPVSEKILSTLNTSKLEEFIKLPYTHQFSFKTVSYNDYRKETAYYILPKLPSGKYMVIASPNPFDSKKNDGFCYRRIEVTSMLFSYRHNDSFYEFFVMDRISGAPVKDAELSLQITKQNKTESQKTVKLKTDAYGTASTSLDDDVSSQNIKVTVKREKETFEEQIWYYRSYDRVVLEKISIFTDRNIYRPGQTVYYKIIVAQENDKDADFKAAANYSGKITVRAPDYKDIQEIDFTTNEYGSFSGSFEIPQNTQTGQFTLSVNQRYNQSYRVEEYKRPQFEVTIEQPKGSYKLNEEVTVIGKAVAFAGYPVDGGTVKYKITRSTRFFPFRSFWRFPNYDVSSQQIADGEMICDAEGTFTIKFTALPNPADKMQKPLYQYKISVDVTDINGETQSAATTVIIGAVSMAIELDMPEIVEIENKNRFPLSAVNLSGEKQPAILEYTIIPLESPLRFKHDITETTTAQIIDNETLIKTFPHLDFLHENDQENWKEKDAVASGKFNTATDSLFSIPNLPKLREGYYRIIFKTKDAYNEEVKYETTVFINHRQNSKCWTYKPILLTTDKTTARSGEAVTVTVGTYLQDAKMWYEVIWNDEVICTEWLSFHQSKTTITHTIPKKEAGTLVIYTFLAKDNFVYNDKISILVLNRDKMLETEWITFRDKTMTGAEEQWQLKIKGKEGEKVMAELLCSMYDASLDMLYQKNQFSLPNYISYKSYQYYLHHSHNGPFSSDYIRRNDSKWNIRTRSYYQLKPNVFSGCRYPGIVFNCTQYESVDAAYSVTSNSSRRDKAVITTDWDFSTEIEEAPVAETESTPQPSLRSNFRETAFFYPHLLTDDEGNVSFSFTMPDALTKWNFQGVAHTKEMKNVVFEKSVISQKPLMIVPNAPRFFREGDTIFFSAKVVNLHDNELKGEVTLQLFNALSNKPVSLVINGETRTFAAQKGGSVPISFKMAIPVGLEAVTYRIFASATIAGEDGLPLRFSDGEEKSIPVLSNRMLVTESLPLHVNGNETKKFTFAKMKKENSQTLTNYRYTIEFTPNPIWYAIQALPYMIEYPYDCNEQIFSKLYANSIAAHIVNASPRIKEVFENWQNFTPDAFCSNLEKNQELKNIVLEETPWVLQAQNEAERKQRIGILFDIKRMSSEKSAAILKLKKNQNADGGWSWFKGGNSNRYITQHIVAGFGQMFAMNIDCNSSDSKALLSNAIRFTDAEARKDYLLILNNKNQKADEYRLHSLDVHYLYARALHLSTNKLGKNEEVMYKFYLGQAKKWWDKHSIYEQGLLALTFYYAGEKSFAEKIVAHIKSRAQYNAEMGMYWKKEGNGWFWNESPIERQAILIEAFSTITKKDQSSIEKMQQWLLKQKQTQNWGNTKSTALACHALLLNGYEVLQQPSDVALTIGDNRIEVAKLPDIEAGTGYFKKSWKGEEITPKLADIEIEKHTNGIAWGAAYWQYFEDLDKITAAESPLSMQKSLYLVTRTAQGEVLTPISENNPIAIGDKVRVHLVLKSDRDMEFVHLKDMRASAFEPVNVLSQYKYQGGLWYYESTRDAATNFFFDYLPKGTYVFEYTLVAAQSGTFSNGVATIQCMYAAEFAAHSEGSRVVVK